MKQFSCWWTLWMLRELNIKNNWKNLSRKNHSIQNQPHWNSLNKRHPIIPHLIMWGIRLGKCCILRHENNQLLMLTLMKRWNFIFTMKSSKMRKSHLKNRKIWLILKVKIMMTKVVTSLMMNNWTAKTKDFPIQRLLSQHTVGKDLKWKSLNQTSCTSTSESQGLKAKDMNLKSTLTPFLAKGGF